MHFCMIRGFYGADVFSDKASLIHSYSTKIERKAKGVGGDNRGEGEGLEKEGVPLGATRK